MILEIKPWHGRCTHYLEVEPSDTMEIALQKVHEKQKHGDGVGYPPDQCHFLWGGMLLENARTLSDYGIEDGSVLHLHRLQIEEQRKAELNKEAEEKLKPVGQEAGMLATGEVIRHPYAVEGEEHRLYLPKSYQAGPVGKTSTKHPVIVYMHGAGGVGNHHHSLRQGLPAVLGRTGEQKALYEFGAEWGFPMLERDELAIAQDFPFIVIFPMATPFMKADQWPEGGEKSYPTQEVAEDQEHTGLTGHVIKLAKGTYVQPEDHWEALRPRILELLDQTVENFDGDASRVHVLGMSVGGKGALELAATLPERFSAVAACCAFFGRRVPDYLGVTPALPKDAVKALTGMPLWLFHGKRDALVQPENARLIIEAMREANANSSSHAVQELVKFNEYDYCPPGSSPMRLDNEIAPQHGVFEYAFRNPELYSWLLQFKKDHPN